MLLYLTNTHTKFWISNSDFFNFIFHNTGYTIFHFLLQAILRNVCWKVTHYLLSKSVRYHFFVWVINPKPQNKSFWIYSLCYLDVHLHLIHSFSKKSIFYSNKMCVCVFVSLFLNPKHTGLFATLFIQGVDRFVHQLYLDNECPDKKNVKQTFLPLVI